MPLWTRRPEIEQRLYSRKSVDRLKDFTDMVVERAVKQTHRVEIVNRLLEITDHPRLQEFVTAIVAEAREVFPGHNVDINLMPDLTEVRLSDRETEHIKIDTFVPERDTWCRYTVAAGQPIEVLDSMVDLVVCDSPYTGIVRSYMGAPLIVRSWTVGVFCVYSEFPKESWDKQDKRRVVEWANRTSQALENELSRPIV